MFLCDGLFGESVVVVCEFNGLYCVCVCEGIRGDQKENMINTHV